MDYDSDPDFTEMTQVAQHIQVPTLTTTSDPFRERTFICFLFNKMIKMVYFYFSLKINYFFEN